MPAALIWAALTAGLGADDAVPVIRQEPHCFAPLAKTSLKAPDGGVAMQGAYSATIPAGLLDDRGTIGLWFKPTRLLRGEGRSLDLVKGPAIKIGIDCQRNCVAVNIRFERIIANAAAKDGGKTYAYSTLLTHLKADRWYHAAWTWDVGRAGNNAFYLDGIAQENPWSPEKMSWLKAGSPDGAVTVGDPDLITSALCLYDEPLSAGEVRRIGEAAGHQSYTDEGTRFTGRKWIAQDVDLDHPVYRTSFDDPAVLADWRLEGGKAMRVAGGNLVLESDTQSTQSERVAGHLVCWLRREVPADFLLEFTVRPQDRKRGLNIVFFSARGLAGENIFEPPIKPRNGLFEQYHSGDIDNYHISYWSGGRGTSNLRKNKGFYLGAIGKDLVWDAPEGEFQTVRVYKRGGQIRLTVDDVLSLSFDDDGKTYGPVLDHSGWIGLRQMAHTRFCEYGHFIIWPLR